MFTSASSPAQRAWKRTIVTSAILVTAGMALSGCASGNAAVASKPDVKLTALTPAPTGELDEYTWSSYAEPYSLDYAYAFDYADNAVLANVCESLLRWNPDLSVSPGLAEKVENPTPTTWVYSIRPGVTFNDGTPLTAADVVASLSRHMDPAVGSSWFSVYQNVASIEQTGDMEVTVTTTIPDSQFNNGMAQVAGVVESAATLAEKGADYGNSTGGVNCTGPFSLTSWKSGEGITLERNDNYWDKDLAAKSKKVNIVFLEDPNTRVNSFKSGEVDGGWMIPSNAIDQLTASGAGDIYHGVNTSTANLIVSDLEGPLGDLTVRQALLMAIDREGLVQAAVQGYGEVSNALTTPSVWENSGAENKAAAFDSLETYDYDLDAAKKLIEEAGVAGQEITIATSPINSSFDIVSQAAASAATAIGLKPTIESLSPSKYTALFSDPSAREGIDLFYTEWYLSSTDPLEMFSVIRTGEFSNYGNWSNPEFDTIVTDAVSTMDPIERGAESVKAQQIANEQLPWLPLYTTPVTVWIGERITGVAPSINNLYYPWAATIGAR